jgi:hypothetical protein
VVAAFGLARAPTSGFCRPPIDPKNGHGGRSRPPARSGRAHWSPVPTVVVPLSLALHLVSLRQLRAAARPQDDRAEHLLPAGG